MSTTPTKFKVINTPDLIWLNSEAVKSKRNRAFTDEIGDLLDPDGIHFVAWSMLHNDCEIRVRLMMKFKDTMLPQEGFLDMSFENYASLKEIES